RTDQQQTIDPHVRQCFAVVTFLRSGERGVPEQHQRSGLECRAFYRMAEFGEEPLATVRYDESEHIAPGSTECPGHEVRTVVQFRDRGLDPGSSLRCHRTRSTVDDVTDHSGPRARTASPVVSSYLLHTRHSNPLAPPSS